MVTKDDRGFSNLLACAENIGVRKMPYFAYLMQKAGFDLSYRYSIRLDSIKSHGLISSLGDLVSQGFVTRDYLITDNGETALEGYFITKAESELCERVVKLAKTLSVTQLYMLCVIDIIIQDTLAEGGYLALIRDKDKIKSTVKGLCSAYTDEDFDTSVGILRGLRKEGSDEK